MESLKYLTASILALECAEVIHTKITFALITCTFSKESPVEKRDNFLTYYEMTTNADFFFGQHIHEIILYYYYFMSL